MEGNFISNSILKRRLFLLFILPFTYLCLSEPVYGQQQSSKKQLNTIIVGGDQNFPPSTFIQDGRPAGFQVDVIKAVAAAVKIDVQFKFTPWKDSLKKLKQGKIDVVAMSYSQERERIFDFSVQYALNSFGLMVREGSNIKAIGDIAGKKILVQQGGVMREYMDTKKFNADITFLEDVETIIKHLSAGRYDGAFLSKKTAFFVAKKLGISGLKFTHEKINPRRTALAVTEGNYELVQLFNEGLAIINANGQLQSINEKWFGTVKGDFLDAAFVKIWAIRAGIGTFTVLVIIFLWNRRLKKEINYRKQIEKALQESEERYKGIFNYSTSGIAVYDVKNNGDEFVFKDLNRATEKIENTKRSELIGRNVLDVFPGVKEFGLFDVFKRVWKTGSPEHHPISMYKDDRILGWRENFVYKLPTGEIVAVYSDETEHKRAEQALLESERKYRNLFESSIDSLFLLDVDSGKIIDCNEATLTLHQIESREQFIGLSPYEFSPEFQPNGLSSQKAAINYINKAYNEGSAEFEWIHQKRDGTKFTALVTLSAMSVEGRKILLAVNKDLSEITEANEKREKLIIELQEALDNIQTLKGLLPICATCKKIRDDKGYWNRIESYIQKHSKAEFSHGMCPECSDKLYGNEDWYIKMKKKKGYDQ